MSGNVSGAQILGILMVSAAAIIISQHLFPLFLVLTVLLGLIGLVIFVVELSSGSLELSAYVGGAFVVLLLLTGITYVVGFGLGGTSMGHAVLEVYYSVTGAKQEISEELQRTMNTMVDEACTTLSEGECLTLKASIRTAKTLDEVSSNVARLQKAGRVADSIIS
jgi:hypothetical protein